MAEHPELYTSSIVKGSYFNQMINCGPNYNRWIEIALGYIPTDILWEYRDNLVFIGTGAMDACRVAPALRKSREIIVLSERIFPKRGANEGHLKVRYFIFVVLHEFAHAVLNHRSPLLDNLTKEENEAQEKEADDLAIRWFNAHVQAINNQHLKAISLDEIYRAKAENQILIEKVYEQG
jgi:hypothetical protein